MTDLPPVTFPSGRDALRWADRRLAEPEVKCWLGKYRRGWQGVYARSAGGSRWSPDDFRDLAATVLIEWSEISNPINRLVLREVHGDPHPDRRDEAAAMIADLTRRSDPRRTWLGCRTVAYAAIEAQQRVARNKRRPGVGHYAEALGIGRSSVHRYWLELIRETEEIVSRSVDAGERELETRLESAGQQLRG